MIIGITGKKHSGKDTIANYLVDNYEFRRYGFADPMKEVCKEIFLWDDDWVNGQYKETIDERWNISPRQALQLLGTEFAQYSLSDNLPLFKEKIGRKLWVKRFKYWYEKEKNKLLDSSFDVAISDVRFLHEANELRAMDSIIIRVKREQVENLGDIHPSETEMENICADFTIINNASSESLYWKIDNLVDIITEKEDNI